MNQIKTKGTRPILSEDILDIEDKREFAKRMNYGIIIPRILVKINPTYYQKLGQIMKGQSQKIKFSSTNL